MTDLQQDPVTNAIYNGIKIDIETVLTQQRYRAAVIFIYAGMDAMAFLSMPQNQDEVKPIDFIKWADRYILFLCKEQLTGNDLYGARCSMLHVYGVASHMSRTGKCRTISYYDDSIPEVVYKPSIDKETIYVSITALKNAFFKGIDNFLIDTFADKNKAPIVEDRLRQFIQIFPTE